jgi:uncharacterized protein (UPF0548 family)
MTRPDLGSWSWSDSRYRRSEASAVIGAGDELWERATEEVLRWGVKTASGFTVHPALPVTPGARVTVIVRVFGIAIVEPVEVVTVVDRPDRVGFAYRTLPGHPVDGEEAFIVHRDGLDVHVTVRSLTRPASQQPWKALHPGLRIVQHVARRRYLRALR